MKTIVLFTASYPYSAEVEDTFLEEELLYLNKYFYIIIVPHKKKGTKSKFISRLENVTLIEDYIDNSKINIFKNTFSNFSLFFDELIRIRHLSHLKSLINHLGKTQILKKFIQNKLREGKWKKDFLFYTFWFDSTTTALNLLKDDFGLKVITNVHGRDLYYERHNGYIPCRIFDIKKIDKIIAVSEDGYEYIKSIYKAEKKAELFHLLSKDYGLINPINKSNILKIVSCSFVIKLKRVDILMKFLSNFSNEFKIEIEWTHIGNGTEFNELINLKKVYSHTYFDIKLLGFKNINEIMNVYKNESFDYFITLSSTEGGVPFVLREAASCEIPLIGTNVGGIPEIILDKENGFLLTNNPTYEEFKTKLIQALKYKDNKKSYLELRKKSRKIFLQKFEAKRNHKKFIEFLQKLYEGNQ